jgi:vacuolar protein sorting-associated protein 13A/C
VRNNGPIGGALGLLTGVGGVIIKPVTGVLDALSKTSQGFRTFAMGHEDHANTQRIRNPRVLYGSNAAIKSYSTVDSQMYQALEYLDRKFANSPFIQSFMINEERSALVVL